MALPTLVFDLDGTLSNPFDGIWKSVNHALSSHGFGSVPRESFRAFIGPPIDRTFRTLAPGADQARLESLVGLFRERYGRVGYSENVLYPGIEPTLRRLREADFRCGICTNKRRDFAVQIVELFELDPYFAFVSGGDVGVRKTDQLRKLLDQRQIDRHAIMIGDRASDLEAASAHGLRGVGVSWGFGTALELESADPWAICDSPEALLERLLELEAEVPSRPG